jgi:hypothetical protein
MADSQDLFNQFLLQSNKVSGQFGVAGGQDTGTAANYFRSLLGNRQAQMQAISPAVNQTRAEADAAKKQQAEKGTARTGGVAAGNQQIEDAVRKQISSLLGDLGPKAASGLASIGSTELQTMLNSLGIGTQASQQDVASRRQANAEMWGALIGGIGDVLGGAASAGKLFGI